MNIDDLKHLAELERAATPGLWHWDGTYGVLRTGPIGDRSMSTITVGATCHECGVDDECEVWFNSEADKTLLLALRNHARDLIEMATAEAAYREAEQEGDGIATHWDGCWQHHLGCAIAKIEELQRGKATVAEWEAAGEDVKALAEQAETWFASMYRIINALGSQRGMGVPEDIEHAAARAKELADAAKVVDACDRLGCSAQPDSRRRWWPIVSRMSDAERMAYLDSRPKDHAGYATFAEAVLAAAAWLEGRKE